MPVLRSLTTILAVMMKQSKLQYIHAEEFAFCAIMGNTTKATDERPFNGPSHDRQGWPSKYALPGNDNAQAIQDHADNSRWNLQICPRDFLISNNKGYDLEVWILSYRLHCFNERQFSRIIKALPKALTNLRSKDTLLNSNRYDFGWESPRNMEIKKNKKFSDSLKQ